MSSSVSNSSIVEDKITNEIRVLIANSGLFNQKIADQLHITPSDLQVLHLIALSGPMTPGSLAKATGLTTGGVTVLIDRLQSQGFVCRKRNEKDRRSVFIHLIRDSLADVEVVYENKRTDTLNVIRAFNCDEQSIIFNFLFKLNNEVS
ncbi:MarR family winged helix-turn-helix transcriptional regulator [Nitrincola alkalilacustris]|uniref:MarR family winged helix-turn-helix transcriptional regulator n=1 Tax=Nitrincola alkalilacustris TaxID=1571224 RepID=UPI00124F219D|nr:MarR family transcriptional regulator [Nitrincola alkalilacustris]